MALFGAPVAHEDHAQRAAYAALAMQAALARYREELARTRGIEFRVRMGLNTGLVVVGAIGDNLRMDYTAVGDTTNTAARMQQLAEPGQIVVAEATERLIAPFFELRALGTFTVKNRAHPVAAWELERARRHVSRLAARAAHGLSPFVGRDDALATLERVLAAARGGRGQVALVVGEAGIGKSRLLLEFRRRAGDITWLQGDCISFGQAIPFLPIVDVIKQRFGIEDADDAPRMVEDEDAVQIVRATLGVPDLPAELAERIAGKAGGNPFFLEELGRALVESGGVRAEGARFVLAVPAATLVVPERVQDVIAARLDRLEEPAKRTVQTASVIGREFALTLLRRVSDVREELERSLGELKRIEMIYERAGLSELEYVFRHALTQDVAYGSLLQAERRRLHAMIGAALEELYAGRLEARTEELVYHFRRGEVWDKLARYAREAAERATALCVDDKAVEYYETVLDALRHLPETSERARLGVDVRLAMRAPLWRGGSPTGSSSSTRTPRRLPPATAWATRSTRSMRTSCSITGPRVSTTSPSSTDSAASSAPPRAATSRCA